MANAKMNMMLSKRSLIRVLAGLASANIVLWPVLAADQGRSDPIPNFSTFDYGWVKDGQVFHAPSSVIGPISYDKAHPIMRTTPNARGEAHSKFPKRNLPTFESGGASHRP